MGLLQHLIKTLKHLCVVAFLDLNWMAEFFYYTVTCVVEKIFYLLFKVFEQFYKKSFHAEWWM